MRSRALGRGPKMASGDRGETLFAISPKCVRARLRIGGQPGALHDQRQSRAWSVRAYANCRTVHATIAGQTPSTTNVTSAPFPPRMRSRLAGIDLLLPTTR